MSVLMSFRRASVFPDQHFLKILERREQTKKMHPSIWQMLMTALTAEEM